MAAIAVYHFVNNNVGGVFSVVKNLLRFSQLPSIENHVIYTINKEVNKDFEMPILEGAASQRIFYYSAKWNFYYTCRQLAKILPNAKVLIIAHDWLELGMMSNLGLQNPVIQFVHGNYDYYYNLSLKHQNVIDAFICVSPVIQKKITALLPPEKTKTVQYFRFPVPEVINSSRHNETLKVLYASGNLIDVNKQFSLVPEINNLLQKNKVAIDWIIVGKGRTKEEVQELMESKTELTYFEQLPNEDLLSFLTTADIFLLPSLKEGFPVAVVEAMKAGLVPLVTNWEDATAELIVDGETGFYVATGDAAGYANKIEGLHNNRNELKKMAKAAADKANELFNSKINTAIIEEEFKMVYNKAVSVKFAKKVYGSRLDEPGIPNIFTKTIRSLKIGK